MENMLKHVEQRYILLGLQQPQQRFNGYGAQQVSTCLR
jgi:hypothetical protein